MAMKPESAARVQGAKGVPDQYPFLVGGDHRLAIEEFRCYISPKWGTVAKAAFRVVASSTLQAGSCHTVQWRIDRQPQYASQTPDYELVVQFLMKLLGSDDPAAGATALLELDQREKEQPIRGMLIDAQSRDNKERTWTNHTWSHVKQTGEEIAAARAALDRNDTPANVGAPVVSASGLAAIGVK